MEWVSPDGTTPPLAATLRRFAADRSEVSELDTIKYFRVTDCTEQRLSNNNCMGKYLRTLKQAAIRDTPPRQQKITKIRNDVIEKDNILNKVTKSKQW